MKMKKNVKDAYDFFLSTLSSKTRLAIIHALTGHAMNVSQLTQVVGQHQTTVSHNLRRLQDCGFVFVRKNGKKHIYELNQKTIKPLLAIVDQHVEEFCKKRCT